MHSASYRLQTALTLQPAVVSLHSTLHVLYVLYDNLGLTTITKQNKQNRTKQQTNKVYRKNGLFALEVIVEVVNVPEVAMGSNPLVYIQGKKN